MKQTCLTNFNTQSNIIAYKFRMTINLNEEYMKKFRF